MKQLNLLSLILVVNFICSCTITKRHFKSGYHIEWNRKIRTASDTEEISGMNSTNMYTTKQNTLESESLLTGPSESIEQVVVAAVPVVEEKQVMEDQKEESPLTSKVEIQTSREIKTMEPQVTKEKEDEIEETPKRRMHPLMWGIWAMWSIAITCMFFVTFYAEFLIGVAIGFFIAMIFALIVLSSLRKNPVKQPFKGLSYGFGIPAIIFGVIASAGLGLILVILLT